MATPGIVIRPVRVTDMLAITRMTYNNMTGVDQYFTRLVNNRLYRWLGYVTWPIYFLMSGDGYKAQRNGRILGCAYLHLRDQSGYIFNVSVNQPYRRQGVASQLMAYLEEKIRNGQRLWAALQVDDGNMAAENLYSRLGYRPFHPVILRRDAPGPIRSAVNHGLAIEPQPSFQGRRLFAHYQRSEHIAGDQWAEGVVEEYQQALPPGDIYWRCLLGDEEIGAVWQHGPEHWPQFNLALLPEYWGHIITGGLVKMLVERLADRPTWIDLRLGSSAHHQAAVPLMAPLGFQERIQPRILMLKRLD